MMSWCRCSSYLDAISPADVQDGQELVRRSYGFGLKRVLMVLRLQWYFGSSRTGFDGGF